MSSKKNGADPKVVAVRIEKLFGVAFDQLTDGSRRRRWKQPEACCAIGASDIAMRAAQTDRRIDSAQPPVQRSVAWVEKATREPRLVLFP